MHLRPGQPAPEDDHPHLGVPQARRSMKDVALTLRMCLGDEAATPEGPGWYIYAQGETQLIRPTRVAPQAAEIIADAFQQVVLATAGTIVAATPHQIVGSSNALLRQKIQQDLAEAEAAAQRIKGLRTQLQALEGASSGDGRETAQD